MRSCFRPIEAVTKKTARAISFKNSFENSARHPAFRSWHLKSFGQIVM